MYASLWYTVQFMVYGDKFEYNYDEWVSTLYCRDNLLKLVNGESHIATLICVYI